MFNSLGAVLVIKEITAKIQINCRDLPWLPLSRRREVPKGGLHYFLDLTIEWISIIATTKRSFPKVEQEFVLSLGTRQPCETSWRLRETS